MCKFPIGKVTVITTPSGFSFIKQDGPIDFDYKVHVPAYAQKMKWTTEPPTKPGWYWVRVPQSHASMRGGIFVVSIEIFGGKQHIDWLVDGYEWDPPFEESHITHWLGPLPVPEPPK